MLDLQQIKNEYSEQLQVYERALIREYLQYKILQAVFESKYANKLSFLGGTALRIMHGNDRFSEDIDLDNFGLSWESFIDLSRIVELFLMQEGFLVETRLVEKEAFHCYLRFPDLLFRQGLTPHSQEKIFIQLDTVAQEYNYVPEVRIINKFDVFTEIRVTPVNLLLSQKIVTAVNRKRPRGRDFYDITFLFSKTGPDFGYLKQKLGIDSPERLREGVLLKIADFNFTALGEDVAPFLISKDQVKRVGKFKDFWTQVDMDQPG